MCYVITAAGLELLRAGDRSLASAESDADLACAPLPASSPEGKGGLRQARHDVHVTGWVLALERVVTGTSATLVEDRGKHALAADACDLRR